MPDIYGCCSRNIINDYKFISLSHVCGYESVSLPKLHVESLECTACVNMWTKAQMSGIVIVCR